MDFLSPSLDSDSILSSSGICFPIWKGPINIYINFLKLKSGLVFCSILDFELNTL